MKLITISGLDGSGKSTQIDLLKNYLESQNKRVFYFHAIAFSLANKIAKKKNSVGKSVTKATFLQITLRRFFLMIDIWRFKKLYKKLEKEKFDYILSDRYFYDSAINIKYLELNCHPEFISGSSEMPKQVRHDNIMKPDIALYLQTDPQIIMSRERKPDQGIGYLEKKKELYETKISDWGIQTLDGNRNKEEIFEEIKKMIDHL